MLAVNVADSQNYKRIVKEHELKAKVGIPDHDTWVDAPTRASARKQHKDIYTMTIWK